MILFVLFSVAFAREADSVGVFCDPNYSDMVVDNYCMVRTLTVCFHTVICDNMT